MPGYGETGTRASSKSLQDFADAVVSNQQPHHELGNIKKMPSALYFEFLILKRTRHLPACHFPESWQDHKIEGDDAADRVARQPKHHHSAPPLFAIQFQGSKGEGFSRLHLDL